MEGSVSVQSSVSCALGREEGFGVAVMSVTFDFVCKGSHGYKMFCG